MDRSNVASIHVIVIHSDERKFECISSAEITLDMLKQKCQPFFAIPGNTLGSLQNKAINKKSKAEHQRIIQNGREIKQETTFYQTKKDKTTVIYQIADRQRPLKADEYDDSIPVPMPTITKQYRYCWVLLANIEECCIALDSNNEQRASINHVPPTMAFTDYKKDNPAAVPCSGL